VVHNSGSHSRDDEEVGVAQKAISPKTSLSFPDEDGVVLVINLSRNTLSDLPKMLSKSCYGIYFVLTD